jgi:hypothetical protein
MRPNPPTDGILFPSIATKADEVAGSSVRVLCPALTLARAHPTVYRPWDARCSASHCSLIQPRWAPLTPSGTRILGRMTIASDAMTRPKMNNIRFAASDPFSAYTDPARPQTGCLCASAHRVARVNAVGARQPSAISPAEAWSDRRGAVQSATAPSPASWDRWQMGDKSLKSKQRDQKHKDAAKLSSVADAKAKQAGNMQAQQPAPKGKP